MVASLSASVADDDPGSAQLVQDHTQELGREALVLGDRLGSHGFRRSRQDKERSYAVIDFRRDCTTAV